ncbi:MAG: GerMN domain-containing protein, partial [Patescibacteria group bacterium]
KNTYFRNPCMKPFETPSYIDIPAHSAPLGLAFIPDDGWPDDYRNDLIVAYHGSWNRSVPTGYKLVRMKLDKDGNYLGAEDFVTGWLAGAGALGRPVAVVAQPDGIAYVTDDKAGVIYKISYIGNGGKNEDLDNLIRVSSPTSGEAISSPVIVKGEARGYWFFEASFPISVLDGDVTSLGIGIAEAQDDWMTENFVPFKASIVFKTPKYSTGTLVLKKDNPSGLPENDVEFALPVSFAAAGTQIIKAYFGNEAKNPGAEDCSLVYAVERRVEKTSAPARAALEELLAGPTDAEKNGSFFTSINAGVRIQALTIQNGIARVDFDETLERAVGGSCRVAAIRSQIVNTLKQFPTVKEVLISINGRTEDILQP